MRVLIPAVWVLEKTRLPGLPASAVQALQDCRDRSPAFESPNPGKIFGLLQGRVNPGKEVLQ
jgi:hypothetical protein